MESSLSMESVLSTTPNRGAEMKPKINRYPYELGGWLAVYAALLVGSNFLARAVPLDGALKYAVALLPMIGVAGCAWAVHPAPRAPDGRDASAAWSWSPLRLRSPSPPLAAWPGDSQRAPAHPDCRRLASGRSWRGYGCWAGSFPAALPLSGRHEEPRQTTA